jgi:hypothetical protein
MTNGQRNSILVLICVFAVGLWAVDLVFFDRRPVAKRPSSTVHVVGSIGRRIYNEKGAAEFQRLSNRGATLPEYKNRYRGVVLVIVSSSVLLTAFIFLRKR